MPYKVPVHLCTTLHNSLTSSPTILLLAHSILGSLAGKTLTKATNSSLSTLTPLQHGTGNLPILWIWVVRCRPLPGSITIMSQESLDKYLHSGICSLSPLGNLTMPSKGGVFSWPWRTLPIDKRTGHHYRLLDHPASRWLEAHSR
jgi:hypothetical protein